MSHNYARAHLFDIIHQAKRTALPHFSLNEAKAKSLGHGDHREKTIFGDGTLWSMIPSHLGIVLTLKLGSLLSRKYEN